ncbi:glutamine-hydrolyzing carbamoyl-phosphate synthase small subunit [Bdellovibrionota bacterium FG-2]
MTKGLLILEDGTEFPGILRGAAVDFTSMKSDRGYGEVVFNTSMTGYQEILTDPSYFGQIICMTAAHIGNTGVNLEDPESAKVWCAGFVVQSLTDSPSNWRATGNLESYLREAGVPVLTDVDTRKLTQHIRSRGALRGLIIAEGDRARAGDLFKKLPPFEGRDLIKEVTTDQAYTWEGSASPAKPKYRVVAVDFGVKRNLLRALEERGCSIEVVPASTSAEAILDRKPDGVFLSNGPGDPAAAPYAAETVRKLVGRVPVFGVCMGHQILALAMGAKTYKLKFGHRGGNQPVIDRGTQKVEISSHNHGYSVDARSLPPGLEVSHVNLNDQTVEGLTVAGRCAFSVQYHPEACPGPHDSMMLFDRFVDNMKKD